MSQNLSANEPVPPGQRRWSCPECGQEILLPITRLDPMACQACLEKNHTPKPASMVPGLPNFSSASAGVPSGMMLGGMGGVLIGLLLGGVLGFGIGRATALKPAMPVNSGSATHGKHPTPPPLDDDDSSASDTKKTAASARATPEESDHPDPNSRPGYKWVKPYRKSNGDRVEGHWRKL